MILKNAEVFDPEFNLVRADIAVDGQKISRVAPGLSGGEEIDLTGCIVAPGFVDIHIHGCVGADTCDAKRESIAKMAAYLARSGVTSFCPTTMTVALPEIEAALACVRDCMEHPPEGAAVRGANMEGPYLSSEKKGAQNEEFIRKPDFEEFRGIFERSGGIIKVVDVAPESEGAEAFITAASRLCRVSFAHSGADYEQAKESFRWGVTHVTHLFNAMTGLHHRAPGAVGAVFDSDSVRAEIICDGIHIHPAVLRLAFHLLGGDRAVVISDALPAAGLPDGSSFLLGGQRVYVKGGRAALASGSLAGSTTNVCEEVRNLVRFGIPLRQAVKSATLNPAKEIGAQDEIGTVEPGKYADLVALGRDGLPLRLSMAKGVVYRNELR